MYNIQNMNALVVVIALVIVPPISSSAAMEPSIE